MGSSSPFTSPALSSGAAPTEVFQPQAQPLCPSCCLRHQAQGSKRNKRLVRIAAPDLAIQSPGRSREVLFSLAQAKRDQAAASQCCSRLLKGSTLPRAVPKPALRLSCLSRLTSRTREVGPATERPSGVSHPNILLPLLGAIIECWGTLSPREEPHTSTLECVLLERCATGKTATPNWRSRESEEASGEEDKAGD